MAARLIVRFAHPLFGHNVGEVEAKDVYNNPVRLHIFDLVHSAVGLGRISKWNDRFETFRDQSAKRRTDFICLKGWTLM